jgi:transcription antitermination protein NusB
MPLSSRRNARILAFQIIYQRDKTGIQPASENGILESAAISDAHRRFCQALIDLTQQNKGVIDREIQRHLKNWRQARITDSLNALFRVAVCELLFFPETDGKVVLNEAIEICRGFVDRNATGILNGVLNAVWKTRLSADGDAT